MKKLLFGTAAIALGVAAISGPAKADGLKLELGGHMKGYVSWVDQDERSATAATAALAATADEDVRNFDILRETEVHFTGETTLDNGLTVGVHIEADVDGSGTNDQFTTEEAYAYFSGAWGRFNFGAEDGAAYLLQVAAPSADSNSDGLRQYVAGTNYGRVTGVGTALNSTFDDIFSANFTEAGVALNGTLITDTDGNNVVSNDDLLAGANLSEAMAVVNAGGFARFDYDQAVSGSDDKLTYLSPVFNGFQLGVSYTPEIGNGMRDFGNNDDDSFLGTRANYGDVWDLAARFEGQLGDVGVTIGGGWTHAELESNAAAAGAAAAPVFYRENGGAGGAGFDAGIDDVVATLDDREAWNVGADFNWGAFGLGAAYTEDDLGVSGDNLQRETWVVGIDYTTGPFKLGASYYTQDQNFAESELETDRWTGGVVYTYGPGMTFRGSVSFIDHDEDLGITSDSADSTNLLLGTQIDF